MRFLFCLLYLLVLVLAGCSVSPFGGQGEFRYKPQVLEERFCIGKYEIKKPLKNGPYVKRSPEKVFFSESLEGIEQYYVEQKTLTSCWAAALETAMRYVGIGFTQEQYRRTLRDHCPFENSDAATANQILFAASETYAEDQGIWVGQTPERGLDIDWCHLMNWAALIPGVFESYCTRSSNGKTPDISEFYALDLVNGRAFESTGITLTRTNRDTGAITNKTELNLISSLKQLLSAMDDDYPVVVGMNRRGGGHVINLKEVVFYTNDYRKNRHNDNYAYNLNSDTYLDYVIYLDPMLGYEPIKMSGDSFLETVQFAFYIEH